MTRTAPESGSGGPGRLVVLSGPSGVGKSTVLRRLRSDHPEVWVSVSATTRFPRPGEEDGVHYHFLDRAEFVRRVEDGEFLEWAEFAGNLYGTPRAPVERRLAAGRSVLLEIDLQGARQVRASAPHALLVFLRPPSWEELVHRLTNRGTEDAAVVDRRLATAREEMVAEGEFDVTLVNDDVEDVCRELVALVGSPSPTEA
ncbi:MAG TPA: guanylate kinase [Jiangellales bacterium]|nr:guanylate kinase [Jiangellales bacterium]